MAELPSSPSLKNTKMIIIETPLTVQSYLELFANGCPDNLQPVGCLFCKAIRKLYRHRHYKRMVFTLKETYPCRYFVSSILHVVKQQAYYPPLIGEKKQVAWKAQEEVMRKQTKGQSLTQLAGELTAAGGPTFYGATYLLDVIGEKLGITQDLKAGFPETYRQILSIAYYLVLEDHNPLYRFEKWESLHKHPYGKTMTSQRSSDLFASIAEEDKQHFFTHQGKRRSEKEYWAYDITSISSYSECLRQVQYGKNKENDRLPQLNLALVFYYWMY